MRRQGRWDSYVGYHQVSQEIGSGEGVEASLRQGQGHCEICGDGRWVRSARITIHSGRDIDCHQEGHRARLSRLLQGAQYVFECAADGESDSGAQQGVQQNVGTGKKVFEPFESFVVGGTPVGDVSLLSESEVVVALDLTLPEVELHVRSCVVEMTCCHQAISAVVAWPYQHQHFLAFGAHTTSDLLRHSSPGILHHVCVGQTLGIRCFLNLPHLLCGGDLHSKPFCMMSALY